MKRYRFLIILLVLMCITRFVPHPWNFTPIGAIGFLGAYYLKPWWVGIIASFAGMIISDSVIGFYHWPILVSVYAGFALYALWGQIAHFVRICHCEKPAGDEAISTRLPRSSPVGESLAMTALTILGGSFTFFLLTNSAVWLFGTMYPHTFDGLVAALVAGIPFYRNMLFGDILYIGVPFMAIEYIKTLHALNIHTSEGN